MYSRGDLTIYPIYKWLFSSKLASKETNCNLVTPLSYYNGKFELLTYLTLSLSIIVIVFLFLLLW